MAWQVAFSFIAIALISQSRPVQCSGEAVWLNSSTSKAFLNFFTDFLFYTSVFTADQMEDIYAITETILTLQEQMELLMKSQSSILQAINMAFASAIAKVIVLDSGGASLNEKSGAVLYGIKSAYQYIIGIEDPVFINEISEMISMFSQSSLQKTDISSSSSSTLTNTRNNNYPISQLEVISDKTPTDQQLAGRTDFTSTEDVADYNFPETVGTLEATSLQNQNNKAVGISTLNPEMDSSNAIISQNDSGVLPEISTAPERTEIKSTTSEAAAVPGSGLNMDSQYYPKRTDYHEAVEIGEGNADMHSELTNSREFSQLEFKKIGNLPDVTAAPNRGASESVSFSEDNVPVRITPYTSTEVDVHSDNDKLLPFRRETYGSDESSRGAPIPGGQGATKLIKGRRIVRNRKVQSPKTIQRRRRPYIIEDETRTRVSFGTDTTKVPYIGDSPLYQISPINTNEPDINSPQKGAEEIQSPSAISYDSGESYIDHGDELDSTIDYNNDKTLADNHPEIFTDDRRNLIFVDSLRMKLMNSNAFLDIFDSDLESEQALSIMISASEVLAQKLGFNDIITGDLIQLVTQYISSTESSANAFYYANAISSALSEILVNNGLITDETAVENAEILANAIPEIIRIVTSNRFQRSDEFSEKPGNVSMEENAGVEDYTDFSENQKYDGNGEEDINDYVENPKTDYVTDSQDYTDSVEYPEAEVSLDGNDKENKKQETFETVSAAARLSSASAISRISAIVTAVKSVGELNTENVFSLVNQLRPLISSSYPYLTDQDILLQVFFEISSALINILNSSNRGDDIPFSETYAPIVAEVLRILP